MNIIPFVLDSDFLGWAWTSNFISSVSIQNFCLQLNCFESVLHVCRCSRQILMGRLCSHGRGMWTAIGVISSSVRLLAWTKCNLTSLHSSNEDMWEKKHTIFLGSKEPEREFTNSVYCICTHEEQTQSNSAEDKSSEWRQKKWSLKFKPNQGNHYLKQREWYS